MDQVRINDAATAAAAGIRRLGQTLSDELERTCGAAQAGIDRSLEEQRSFTSTQFAELEQRLLDQVSDALATNQKTMAGSLEERADSERAERDALRLSLQAYVSEAIATAKVEVQSDIAKAAGDTLAILRAEIQDAKNPRGA